MSAPEQPPTKRWYDANCHCGSVRLRFKCSTLYEDNDQAMKPDFRPHTVSDCNCSICVKNGYMNVYPEDPEEDIEWTAGRNDVTEYSFGREAVQHCFCSKCGSSIVLMVDFDKIEAKEQELYGKKNFGINARMIKGIDVDKLAKFRVDGRSRGEMYAVPTP